MRLIIDDDAQFISNKFSDFPSHFLLFPSLSLFLFMAFNLLHTQPSQQIDNLLQSSKIPIIVGGTNYYIESILWHNLVSPGVGKKRKCDSIDSSNIDDLPAEVKEFIGNPSLDHKMEEMESTTLFEYLKQIDPTMAQRLHPNDKRKIRR